MTQSSAIGVVFNMQNMAKWVSMSMLTLVAGQVKVCSIVQICCKTLNKAATAIFFFLGVDHHSLVLRKGGAVVVAVTDLASFS